jgi:hypothetical protein
MPGASQRPGACAVARGRSLHASQGERRRDQIVLAAEPDLSPACGAVSRHRHIRVIACHLSLAMASLLGAAAWPEPVDQPAVIVNPSGASRRELARIVREALHGVPATLADDALTTSNTLIIEHANPRDSSGRPLNGRSFDRPERFELFTHRSRCMLVQTQTGRRWTLRHTACAVVRCGLSCGFLSTLSRHQ